MRLDVFHALRDLRADKIGALASLTHPAVCTENLIRVDEVGESPKLAQ
jgi:hypothetical protein